MFIKTSGKYYYLDEESFVERITKTLAETDREHPWRMDEIVEIQQRMKSLDDLMFEYLQRAASPDPMETLRRHLEQMVETETDEGN